MALYGHGHDQILLFGGRHGTQNIRREDLISGPGAAYIICHVGHVLQTGIPVKAQLGVNHVPVIEVAVVVVDKLRRITQTPEIVGHALTGLFLEHGLEGVLPRAEVIQAHPREYLELRIHRPSAHHRHRQKPADPLLPKFAEVGNGVLGTGDVFQVVHVKKRLQLDHDNVRLNLRLIILLVLKGSLDLCHGLPGIILRLPDPGINDTVGKAIDKTVVFICLGNIGIILCQCLNRGTGSVHYNNTGCQCKDHKCRKHICLFGGIFLETRCPFKQTDHGDHQNRYGKKDHHHIKCRQIVTGYTDRTADQREIHCGKRCHTEMQNNKIDHAEQKPYHRQ